MNKMKGIPRFNRCLLVAFFRRFFVFAHSLPALVIVPSPIQQHNRIIASFIRIVLCEHVWLVFCCFILWNYCWLTTLCHLNNEMHIYEVMFCFIVAHLPLCQQMQWWKNNCLMCFATVEFTQRESILNEFLGEEKPIQIDWLLFGRGHEFVKRDNLIERKGELWK